MKAMVKRLVWGYNIGSGVGLIALYYLFQYLIGDGSGPHWLADGSVWLAGVIALFIFGGSILAARKGEGAPPVVLASILGVAMAVVCYKWEPNLALGIESVVLAFMMGTSLPETDDQELKHLVASIPVFLPFVWVANLGVWWGLGAAAIWAIVVLLFAPWDAEEARYG